MSLLGALAPRLGICLSTTTLDARTLACPDASYDTLVLVHLLEHLDDLEGPHDPPHVACEDVACCLRILRGQLAMQGAGTLGHRALFEVGAHQRIRRRDVEDVERGADGERALGVDHRTRGASLDVLHREEDLAAVLALVEDGHDVGVAQPRGGAGLAAEAGLERVVGREVGAQLLDGHGAAEPQVAGAWTAQVITLFPEAFPGTLSPDGSVDRAALRAAVLGHPERLRRLESLVHPLVARARDDFLATHATAPLVVLDVPLLFETGGEAGCDAVAVVTAPPEVQRARVLARPGMTDTTLGLILSRQMPDAEKRARADWIIPSHSLDAAAAAVDSICLDILSRRPHA